MSILCLLSLSGQIVRAQTTSTPAPSLRPSAVQLAKILNSSGILQKGYNCSVALENDTATVAAYQNVKSKSPDNDCKIDAVLLARKVFDSCSGLSRVKVRLLDALGTGNSKSITVTVGDISAFSSGKTTMKALMSSLEVINVRPPAPPSRNQGQRGSLRGGAPDRNEPGQDRPDGAPNRNNGERIQLGIDPYGQDGRNVPGEKVYRSARAAAVIHYPGRWDLREHPDQDTEVVMGGMSNNGQLCDLMLRITDAYPALSIDHFGSLVLNEMSRPLKSFKKIDERSVVFGNHGNLYGSQHEVSFELNGMTAFQLNMFWKHADNFCCLSLTCPGWKLQDARDMFRDLLRKIETK